MGNIEFCFNNQTLRFQSDERSFPCFSLLAFWVRRSAPSSPAPNCEVQAAAEVWPATGAVHAMPPGLLAVLRPNAWTNGGGGVRVPLLFGIGKPMQNQNAISLVLAHTRIGCDMFCMPTNPSYPTDTLGHTRVEHPSGYHRCFQVLVCL